MELTATDLIANNCGALSELQGLHLQKLASGYMATAFACFAGIPVAGIFLSFTRFLPVAAMVISGLLGVYFFCRWALYSRAAGGAHGGIKKISATAVPLRRSICGAVLVTAAVTFYLPSGHAARLERGACYEFYYIKRPGIVLGWRRA